MHPSQVHRLFKTEKYLKVFQAQMKVFYIDPNKYLCVLTKRDQGCLPIFLFKI